MDNIQRPTCTYPCCTETGLAALVKFDSGVASWWCAEHAEIEPVERVQSLRTDELVTVYSTYPRCGLDIPRPARAGEPARYCEEPATVPLALDGCETLTVSRCLEHAQKMTESGLWISVNGR